MNLQPVTIELTPEQRRSVVVNILTDSIILDRVYYTISLMNRIGSIDPSNGESSWDAIDQINGYVNAFPFMGLSESIRDEELSNKLANVFNNVYRKELETSFTKDAVIIAEHIYTEWLDVVVKHNRNKLL